MRLIKDEDGKAEVVLTITEFKEMAPKFVMYTESQLSRAISYQQWLDAELQRQQMQVKMEELRMQAEQAKMNLEKEEKKNPWWTKFKI